jgi:hypothetical protein
MSSKFGIPAKNNSSCVVASTYHLKTGNRNRRYREKEIATFTRPCVRSSAAPTQQPARVALGVGIPGVGKDKAGAFVERVSAREILENLTFEALLQLRVLRLRLLEDGDVGVGVFPEGEKFVV